VTEPEQTPLDRLTIAVQEFVNATDPEAPVLIDSAVVVWETMVYEDDGDLAYKVNYANAGRASMSAAVGLLQIGLDQVLADIRPDADGD
jgi:hypothetical protein